MGKYCYLNSRRKFNLPGICYLKIQTEFFIIDHTLCDSLYIIKLKLCISLHTWNALLRSFLCARKAFVCTKSCVGLNPARSRASISSQSESC